MSTVLASAVPLYLQGFVPARHVRKFAHLAMAPKIPLHQLGWLGVNAPQLVSVAAGVATKAATPGIVAATGATGIAAGALTAGIGAGIAILVGVLGGLWAKHEQRIAGAKAENQAINSAVQTFDAGLKAIFAAANSSDPTQNVPGSMAAQQVEQLLQKFFAQMAPFTHAAGAADASNGGANCGTGDIMPGPDPCAGTPGGHPCNSSCTATCCVGCADLYPTMLQAVQVLNNPNGGTVKVCTVYGSKYGANLRTGYTLTYTPPKIAISATSIVGDAIAAITGQPSGSGAPGSSNSLLWIGAALLAAWALL